MKDRAHYERLWEEAKAIHVATDWTPETKSQWSTEFHKRYVPAVSVDAEDISRYTDEGVLVMFVMAARAKYSEHIDSLIRRIK